MTATTTQGATERDSRTPTDFALEFAEYMARGAEHLINAVNADAAVRLRIAESDDVDDDTEHDAQASVDEALRGLLDDIGNFRRRRDRAQAAPQGPALAPLTDEQCDAITDAIDEFDSKHSGWGDRWAHFQNTPDAKAERKRQECARRDAIRKAIASSGEEGDT